MDAIVTANDRLSQTKEDTIHELTDVQLELIGGGSGDVVFAGKPGS